MIGHCALAFSMAIGARAARVVTRSGESVVEATIGGVPVLNNRAGITDFIVMFEEGCTDDLIAKFCDGQCPLFGHPDTGGVAWASVRGKATLETLLKSRGDVKVQSVEPDEVGNTPDDKIEGVVDDEVGVQNTPWGITRVGANRAPNSGGRGVHVYVHDTGIRVSHRDFAGRATTSIDVSTGNLRECRGNPNCAADRNGHGTHCAGTVGGRVYGVARGTTLYSVKVLTDQSTYQFSWNWAAIGWVTRSGRRPAVSSMSLGGAGTQSSYNRVISAATQAGIVVVTASGNDRANACGFTPGNAPQSLNVGSTDTRNRRSGFSNFGRCVHIMAPGSDVTSAGHRSNTQATTMSGTSMACPHVSGGAALILGRSPRLSVSAVRSSLFSSARAGFIGDLQGSANRFLTVA